MSRREETDVPQDEAVEQPQGTTLYPGDTGQLPVDARRVLVHLLAGPSLDR